MDSKITSMIKIIEEDADSFAQRAEMYYQRRPELMSLVEEIYRAYRALAEQYDHAVGALHHAHRNMAEAFPNQVLLEYSDDDDVDDYVSGDADGSDDLHPFFKSGLLKQIKDIEMLQKETLRLSQENRDLRGQIGKAQPEVKNLKETLTKLETEKVAALLQSKESSDRLNSLKSEIAHTQEEFNKLNEEMQLKLQGLSSAQERCNILERTNQPLQSELERLKLRAREKEEEVDKLNISLQSEQIQKMQSEMARSSLEKKMKEAYERMTILAKMEKEMERIDGRSKHEDQKWFATSIDSRLQDEIKSRGERWDEMGRRNKSLNFDLERMKQRSRVSEEMARTVEGEIERVKEEKQSLSMSLSAGDVKYFALEKINHSLKVELEKVKQSQRECEEELQEMHLQNIQEQTIQSSFEKQLVETLERLNRVHLQKEKSEIEMERIREENKSLDKQNHLANSRIIQLQDEIISLNDLKRRLDDEISLYLEEKRRAQEELSRIKHDRSDQDLTEQIQTVSSNVESLQGLVQDLKDSNFVMKERIKNHEDVRTLRSENLRQLEMVSEKNTLLEKSLSIANAELEGQRREKEELELSSENLRSDIERVVGRMNLLENSLCVRNAEIEKLRGKLKELNGSYHFLMSENEKLEALKGSLTSEINSCTKYQSRAHRIGEAVPRT